MGHHPLPLQPIVSLLICRVRSLWLHASHQHILPRSHGKRRKTSVPAALRGYHLEVLRYAETAERGRRSAGRLASRKLGKNSVTHRRGTLRFRRRGPVFGNHVTYMRSLPWKICPARPFLGLHSLICPTALSTLSHSTRLRTRSPRGNVALGAYARYKVPQRRLFLKRSLLVRDVGR
ncbi:hypothetical protein MHYP_G00296290 [Metynnis hypsauchen]